MTDQNIGTIEMGTDPAGETANQAQSAAKTFTQDEVNAILARTKSQLEKKFASKYEDLGDPEQLRQIKSEWEKKQEEAQVKRGEFERILQEKAQKWETEIQKRDQIIKDYRVNTPLLSAAAQFRAVAPEQVKALLANQVRLNQEGEVEVVDTKGSVRYNDRGEALGVEDLVREFLDSNPHFVAATPATANTKSSHASTAVNQLDLSKLDMKNPEHRKIYAEATNKRPR
jgi:hypothetical protein